MEFCLFKEHDRNAMGINILGYLISGTIYDKQTLQCCVLCYVIDVYMLIKQHESDSVKNDL